MSIHVSGDTIVSHLPAGLYLEQELERQIGYGQNGLVLDPFTDTAKVVDSVTPANNFFGRLSDLLTISTAAKTVTSPGGNLTTTSPGDLAFDHDVATLDSCSSAITVGTGKRFIPLDGATDYRKATTAWADATAYTIGNLRHVGNRSYRCTSPHTSSASTMPGVGSLWKTVWKRDERYVRISDQADIDGRCMWARVDYQSGATLVVDVLRVNGSGSASSWHVIECKGVLIEEARTNLVTYSNTPAQWTIGNTDSFTITANDATGPDGQDTFAKIAITDTTSEFHFVHTGVQAVSASTNYVWSGFVENGDQRYVSAHVYLGTNDFVNVVCDLQTGTVTQAAAGAGSTTLVDYDIEETNAGYRIWLVFSDTTNTTAYCGLQFVSSGTPTFNTEGKEVYAGTAGLYIHGGHFQLEAGSFRSSYIPTAGAAVLRAADTISLATSKFAFNATEGMIFGEAAPVNMEADPYIAYFDDGTASDIILVTPREDAHLAVFTNSVLVANIDAGTFTDGEVGRVAAAFATNDFAATVNGGAVETDNSGALPTDTLTTLRIGSSRTATQSALHLRQLIYTPTRETNAQLQARSA